MSQWIQSGILDQVVFFDAPPGLGTWVVYGARGVEAATAFTTPTVTELDSTNMPGVYKLLLDEQTTITVGKATEMLKLFISAAGWAGKSVKVVLFDPTFAITAAMTESYAADGVAPTLAQSLFMIQQMLTEKSVSGTIVTIKKLDGTTTAFTLTLDDATLPVKITRTT